MWAGPRYTLPRFDTVIPQEQFLLYAPTSAVILSYPQQITATADYICLRISAFITLFIKNERRGADRAS